MFRICIIFNLTYLQSKLTATVSIVVNTVCVKTKKLYVFSLRRSLTLNLKRLGKRCQNWSNSFSGPHMRHCFTHTHLLLALHTMILLSRHVLHMTNVAVFKQVQERVCNPALLSSTINNYI